MNRSFNKSQTLRYLECSAVEVKSKWTKPMKDYNSAAGSDVQSFTLWQFTLGALFL